MPPRSGLERSDFVLWPEAEAADQAQYFRSLGLTGRARLGPRIVEDAPELTCCTVASQIVPAPKKIFNDIAPFTQALMLKMLPDRFDHRSASACRLWF
jgi:hypothetical protein